MPEPLSLAIISGTITVLNGTFTAILTLSRLKEVDEDLQICLKLLTTANRDLNRARQLRTTKFASGHQQYPSADSEFSYIEDVIRDMEGATLSLGQLVEAYRVDHEVNNSISVPHRFKWVLKGKDRFAAQQSYLVMSHNSLLQTIQKMEAIPTISIVVPRAPPSYTEAAQSRNLSLLSTTGAAQSMDLDLSILRSPSQQRKLRGKSSMIFREEHWPQRIRSTRSTSLQVQREVLE